MSFVSIINHHFQTSFDSCLSGFPDPFAVATIGGEQTRTTSVIRKTLNPYWNEVFDMLVIRSFRPANSSLTSNLGK